MKAVVIDGYGGPEVLRYTDVPDPVPADGDVLVHVAAASINPVDAQDRSGGTREWRKLVFPAVIGWDVAGTVRATGAGVRGFAVGDRVMAWAFSTYAEQVVVAANLLVKVPEEIELADAAALPLATMTGFQLITVASGASPGKTVLVSGALGAVGRSAVRAAKDRGARVIAAVRGVQQPEARGIGADDVVAIDDENALASLPAVDVVANTVRGSITERLFALVAPGGTYASVTGAPANAAARPDVKVVAFVSKQDRATLADAAEAVRSGRLRIPIAHRLPLARATEAHELLAKGTRGKILLLARKENEQ